MSTPPADSPGPRRPAGVSRLGLAMGSLATAGTLAVAFFGLGGPPGAATTVALADATSTGAAGQQTVVKTVYVQLPTPTAAPVAAVPQPVSSVVTRQSGSGGDDGHENGGDD